MRMIAIVATLSVGSAFAISAVSIGSFQSYASSYPASVVQNGLQAVYDLKNAGAVGPRSSVCNGTFKVPGIDALPANTIFIGGWLITMAGTEEFSCWDFTGITGGVIVEGNGTNVTYSDSKFAPGGGGVAQFYGLWVSDDGTAPTVTCNYCSFDGKKYTGSVSGYWSGAAFIVEGGANLTVENSLITGIAYDVSKCTNATLTQIGNYIQAYGWNPNADADAPQNISCVSDIENNFYDISDGAALAQVGQFPGSPPNSAVFDTIDTSSAQNGMMTFKSNILYGYALYGSTCCEVAGNDGLPYDPLHICDNHTNRGAGWALKEIIQNNVIQKGNSGYWTTNGDLSLATCISAWTGNIDYDTGAPIMAPNPKAVHHDFNGDGKTDIVWRDTLGNTALWLMNGNAIMNGGIAYLGNVSSNWTIVGEDDFNGDGYADLLWRDTAGDVAIWIMNGTRVEGSSVLANVATNWSIVGTGDFNGDGHTDILWRDTAGDVAIWLMNGTSIINRSSVGNVSTAWTIAGIGDFNGDGHTDILWRDTAGDVAIWLMNGTSIISSSGMGNVSTAWTVAGTGDFNGDGHTDILWRDTAGDVAIWLMNGTSVVNSSSIGSVPTSWTIVGTGQFNGSTNSNILWRDTAGDLAFWLMNGATVTAAQAIGAVPTNWSVQSTTAE